MGGYYTPPPGTGGGGIGGFPKVVAVLNLSAQNTTQTIQLLPDTLPTGDYVLNDYLEVLAPTSDLAYEVSWADETGATNISNIFPSLGFTSIAGYQISGNTGTAPPTTIHAVTGTPIVVTLTVSASSVLTATVTAGNAGLLYAPGDTGNIQARDFGAIYEVLTVGAGGAVETIQITSGGEGYSVSNANATAVITGSGDGNLQLDITALTTDVSFNYHATLVRNQ